MESLLRKEAVLRASLRRTGSALVALSGGVDSALLAGLCAEVMDRRILAVTAASEAVPEEEIRSARALAASLGLAHETVRTEELGNPAYAANPADRCAFCKTELMDVLEPLALRRGLSAILLGVNADDLKDHRPGQVAARARGALFPLADAGLDKGDVRALARRLGLAVWDKPAQPCLASRIPYGEEVTAGKLARISAAEAFLRAEGFADCRVRHYADRASVEVPLDDLGRLEDPALRGRMEARLRSLGFPRVVVDPGGLRSGNLNAALRRDA